MQDGGKTHSSSLALVQNPIIGKSPIQPIPLFLHLTLYNDDLSAFGSSTVFS